MVAYTVAYKGQHRTRKAVASLIEQSALEQKGADAYLKYSLQTLILKSFVAFVTFRHLVKKKFFFIVHWNVLYNLHNYDAE